MIADFLINSSVDLAFFLYPLFIVFIFALPFIILALRKKQFTVRNSLISVLIGAVLVALALYGTYWGILYLGSVAVRSIYGY